MSAYCHIYNRGIEGREIFGSKDDYEVFTGFLRDYLTIPNPEANKKEFKVNGKLFKGVPHQPKNYLGKVELVAYSLMPDHFHLILNQLEKGAVEGFMRSLSTRYSMYFNKRYARSGILFQRPYKSVAIENEADLSLLTRYVNNHDGYSSYPEYSGKRKTAWVKPIKIIEKGQLDQKEMKKLERIVLESLFEPLERSENDQNDFSNSRHLKLYQRVPELFGAVAIFLILTSFGVKNIQTSSAATKSQVSGVKIEEKIEELPQPLPIPATKTMVVINIPDKQNFLEARLEPVHDSTIVQDVKNNERFEFVSVNSGWYEIKLSESLTGFVPAEFTFLEEVEN